MRLALEPDLDVVAEAGDGATALALAREFQPHVVVMDVEMPDMDGISVTQSLCSHQPPCAVVMLTLHDDVATRTRAREAGAVAFVAKMEMDDKLLAAIRQAATLYDG